jgi:hypothetical protein
MHDSDLVAVSGKLGYAFAACVEQSFVFEGCTA